jgi:hypothetical protein
MKRRAVLPAMEIDDAFRFPVGRIEGKARGPVEDIVADRGASARRPWTCGLPSGPACRRIPVRGTGARSMKWILGILGGVVALGALVAAGLYATGNGLVLVFTWALLFGAPPLPFDPADAVAAPDYAERANWAALPDEADLADMLPAGVEAVHAPGAAPVDVFFVHPTGFLKGSSWTYTLDAASASEENTQWMLANQASAFSSCCNVYAPRYRQASIYTYFQDDAVREEILDFAYQDVERAFDHFVEHFNEGRPFILASHSQGTHHGVRLLARRIDGSAEAERLVAAYVIGGGVARSDLDGLADVGLCDGPTELGCAVHWDTWSETAQASRSGDSVGNVCTNPLSWRLDGGRAGQDAHVGGVPPSGRFALELLGDDAAQGMEFPPLEAPLPGVAAAECLDGVLWVTDQSGNAIGERGSFGGDANYHGLDYPLFHMDIRENASLRVRTWLEKAGAGGQ